MEWWKTIRQYSHRWYGQTFLKIWRLVKCNIAERSNKRKIRKHPTKLVKTKIFNLQDCVYRVVRKEDSPQQIVDRLGCGGDKDRISKTAFLKRSVVIKTILGVQFMLKLENIY